MSKTLTAAVLRELLAYDPLTGVFTRLVRSAHCVKVGDVAGSKHIRGYIYIGVLGVDYRAHRLAWLHTHGSWPAANIDHIDGDPSNNRLANLRDVSQRVNMQNQRKARSNNTHGYLGVTRDRKRWAAQIKAGGKHIHVGSFDTAEEAYAAYIAAKRELHAGSTL